MRATVALLLALLTAAASAAVSSEAKPVRLSADIGDQRAIVEVRDLPEAEATEAVRHALDRIAAIERELSILDPDSTVSRLNAAAGQGQHSISPEVGRLLELSLGFCLWSRGSSGPIGGALYELWSGTTPPSGDPVGRAAASAGCGNLMLVPERDTASLGAGSKLDLRHFAIGYAVDLAIESLRESGSTNAMVDYASVVRAIGPGPTGRGWQINLPVLPGMAETLDPILLRDAAAARLSTHRGRFRFGDLSYSPFIDQRSGVPTTGIVGVMVVSELGLDAQALGSALIALGYREGQLRLGGVVPSPSVLWLLGEGEGEPLLATYRWSDVKTR